MIDYYNKLAGKQIPFIEEKESLLGLLLVEFTASQKHRQQKKNIINLVEQNVFHVYAIGNTKKAAGGSTLEAMYKNSYRLTYKKTNRKRYGIAAMIVL